MRTWIFFAILIPAASGDLASAQIIGSGLKGGWVNDGPMSCFFDSALRPKSCTQYHRSTGHAQYQYLWKAKGGFEVFYTSRIGVVGISVFTIGKVVDRKSALTGRASDHAVSYSPNREALVIGVPADGYEFSVRGGAFR